MSSPHHGFKKTLWIGAAGTGIGFGIAKSVRERWGNAIEIVAADVQPKHLIATSAFADRFEQIARITDPEFANQLVEGLKRHAVDTYVPIEETEIVSAARLRESGRLPATVTLVAPPLKVAETCLDKFGAAQWLVANALPTPFTCLLEDAEWQSGGMVIKPRCGRGSVGVHIVHSELEFDGLRRVTPEAVAQTLCNGPEVTVDAFMSSDGKVFRAVCRERVEVKAGVCTKARVFEDATLSELTRQVASRLGLTRTFCMQFMRHPQDQRWLVTDINPRPGAGTRLSAALGVDFLAAMLADAWGLDPVPMLPSLEGKEHFVVRQYSEYVMT